MSEVKNEGPEVVAYLDGAGCIYTAKLLDVMNVPADGLEPLCHHSEALAGYAVLRERIAELERLSAAISSDCNDMANERNQLRAELADLKADAPMWGLGTENQELRDEIEAVLGCLSQMPTPAHIPDAGEGVESWLAETPDGGSTMVISLAQHTRIVSALQTSAMVVPDGWQLVPVEPKHSMIMVGAEKIDEGFTLNSAAAVYRAMLSESPAPGDSR